ncbi:MAG: haloalkane dehalogenase [Ktedonobacteraceae bacterium]
MEILRTPDERFVNLPDYPFAPHYIETDNLRIHYIDEGPRDADPILLLHGEPSWSYLYRKMIPVFTTAGYRSIAPDLVGFGRSDKPAQRTDYTYQRHIDWMLAVIETLNLQRITLVCQDWGGLIGLRLAAENEQRFARIVSANTFLPTGDIPPGEAFLNWQRYSQESPRFNPGGIVKGGCVTKLTQEVIDAYNAPFPDASYMAGARQFPALVPTRPDDPASEANRKAWQVLQRWKNPFSLRSATLTPSPEVAIASSRKLYQAQKARLTLPLLVQVTSYKRTKAKNLRTSLKISLLKHAYNVRV